MRNLTLKFEKMLKTSYGGNEIKDPLDLVVIEILEAAKQQRLDEVIT